MSVKDGVVAILEEKLGSVWSADAKIEWIVDGMLAAGLVTLISAERGRGRPGWLTPSRARSRGERERARLRVGIPLGIPPKMQIWRAPRS